MVVTHLFFNLQAARSYRYPNLSISQSTIEKYNDFQQTGFL